MKKSLQINFYNCLKMKNKVSAKSWGIFLVLKFCELQLFDKERQMIRCKSYNKKVNSILCLLTKTTSCQSAISQNPLLSLRNVLSSFGIQTRKFRPKYL